MAVICVGACENLSLNNNIWCIDLAHLLMITGGMDVDNFIFYLFSSFYTFYPQVY